MSLRTDGEVPQCLDSTSGPRVLQLLSIERPTEWKSGANMRIVLITTIEAVLRVLSRFPFADEVTRRSLLATAGTDNGNYVHYRAPGK